MCGNRLKLWNTIPMRRRIGSGVETGLGDVDAVEEDLAVVERFEEVHTPQQRRLARARGSDQS